MQPSGSLNCDPYDMIHTVVVDNSRVAVLWLSQHSDYADLIFHPNRSKLFCPNHHIFASNSHRFKYYFQVNKNRILLITYHFLIFYKLPWAYEITYSISMPLT